MTEQVADERGVVIGEIQTKVTRWNGETATEYRGVWFSPHGTRSSRWTFDKGEARGVIKH